jgi:hypothetical protein
MHMLGKWERDPRGGGRRGGNRRGCRRRNPLSLASRFSAAPNLIREIGDGRARRAAEGGDVELHGEEEVGVARNWGPGVEQRRHGDLIPGDPRPPPPPVGEAIAIWKGFK